MKKTPTTVKQSKRFNGIIRDVIGRWKETITSTAEPDVAGATELLHRAYPHKPHIFTVRSPVEFYIAQAVLRGRVSKKAGCAMAEELNIDASFIKPLTRLGSPNRLLTSWSRYRHTAAMTPNILTVVTEKHFHNHKIIDTVSGPAIDPLRARIQLQNLDSLYTSIMPQYKHHLSHEEKSAINHRDWRLNFYRAQGHVSQAIMTIHEAISERPDDILNNGFVPNWHRNDAIEADIICRAMGCKDPSVIWPFEIFHHIPAFMQFNNAYLLLTGKPLLQLDAGGLLHCDTGPAVVWPDGKNAWYIDGHVLADFGEKIVLRPETLTKDEIFSISNEEERRVAIDRMGWHRYLTAIDAKIVDKQENWVDNTFEVLIAPPQNEPTRRQEPLRMVLSCRSTGRKYFIAVPRELPNPAWQFGWVSDEEQRRNPAIPIKTCADAQKWLADGATTKYLDYAKHSINVVGAS